MLFNSYIFIFLFLPITIIVYFVLNHLRLTIISKVWLVLASLFFYGYWNFLYLPLILGSILYNFVLGRILSKEKITISRRLILVFGVVGNLMLLGFYKYYDFFLLNINLLTNADFRLLHTLLPLGISFFTFTQIAYLVDAYNWKVKEMDGLNYSLFVSYFPHLLAGPIIHHKEMMPQFDNLKAKLLNYKNISSGLFLFFIGLFKKVVIADTFAVYANNGFDSATILKFFDAWATSLSYTFQLYFDFSGYTDMALGAALMFNIHLPINFDSPYKAANIQDFWRRWHITLSRFLREYIYIPLGGNRNGEVKTYINLMITFLIGGLWHGAGWTFVFWGFLHGSATVIHRIWQRLGYKMPRIMAWFITFNFVNITWAFFRAKSFENALKVVKGMLGLNSFALPRYLEGKLAFLNGHGVEFGSWLGGVQGGTGIKLILMIILFAFVVLFMRNSNEMTIRFKPNWINLIFIILIATYGLLSLTKVSEFLYFQF